MRRPNRLLSTTVLTLSLAAPGVIAAQPAGDADPVSEQHGAGTTPVEEPPLDPGAAVTPIEAPPETPIAAEAPAIEPAEDAAPSAFTIAGFVNTTYNYNLNRPAGGGNAFYSYNAQHNSLLLNAAHLHLTGAVGDAVAWTVELDFGADAAVNNYAVAPGVPVDVQEAYGIYSNDKLGVKVGKFVTYQGIEVIESPANPTISRGLLFGLAEAFHHTGAVVTYQVTDKVDVHAGVVQGWDVLTDTNRGKMGVFKVGVVPSEKVAMTMSGYVGPDAPDDPVLGPVEDDLRISVDLTGVVRPTDTVDVWFQGNVGNEAAGDGATWFGFGIQPVVRLGDGLSLGGRVELFSDEGARTGGERQLINVSIAPAYEIAAGFVMRAEARVDISNEDDYENVDGEAKSNQVVVLADATYSF